MKRASDGETGPVATGGGAARVAPALIATVCTSLPALTIPFLSDDWANLSATTGDLFGRTPYGYYRPIAQATFVLERAVWGLEPLPFHLTNLALALVATALLTILIRRHTKDATLATLAGLLFALHPWHIENVAWVSARSDLLCAVFLFGAILRYGRWRSNRRGLPVSALLLFEASLLSKETGIVLPLLLAGVVWLSDGRRPCAPEVLRGLLPMVVVGLLHFLCVRPFAIGHPGLGVIDRFGRASIPNLLGYGTATLLPAHPELLRAHPRLWACGTIVAAVLLVGMAVLRCRRTPPVAWAAAIFFLILVAPSLLSLEERYFLLPSAASALAVASVLRALGRRAGTAAGALLLLAWAVSAVDHWTGWRAAGRASESLIAGLVRTSRRPGVERVVVANMPRRVHGMPVGIEFDAAVTLSGGRPVRVEYLTYLDFPSAVADFLDGPPPAAGFPGSEVAIDLLVPHRLYAGNVHPGPGEPGTSFETPDGSIRIVAADRLRLVVPRPTDGRSVPCVWRRGKVEPLFGGRLHPKPGAAQSAPAISEPSAFPPASRARTGPS